MSTQRQRSFSKFYHGVLDFVLSTPGKAERNGNFHLVLLLMSLALLGDIVLGVLIIRFVPYTEIDWRAYMQQVEGFSGGERDYSLLRGDTGPLVYPAAFLYVFTFLHRITSAGKDIIAAQYIFLSLYTFLTALVFRIYFAAGRNTMPLWAMFLVCFSHRIHSIFMLRLFNDCIAMLFLYGAVCLFQSNRWRPGCLLYSLAVGVKMNVLLFAPGLFLLLLQANGLAGTVVCLSICAGTQLALGWPFLTTHPVAYMRKAFELNRVFMHIYTVNLRFLSEEVFVSGVLAKGLLLAMVFTLVAFAYKWLSVPSNRKLNQGRLRSSYVAHTLFVSNFIGIVFCRTLHYQFYVWYFHSLPLLLWSTRLPTIVKLLVLVSIEGAFNIYPSTPTSSAVLQLAHVTLVVALWMSPVPPITEVEEKQDKIK